MILNKEMANITIMPNHVHWRLLKRKTLDLQTAFDEVRSFKNGKKHSMSYQPNIPLIVAAVAPNNMDESKRCSNYHQRTRLLWQL